MRFPKPWIVLVALCASRVEAQSTAAIGLTLDPSVRDAGMGGAAAASFWTNGEASWCNPALLGSVRGIGYDYSSTQFVPSLADDVFFRAERFRIGRFGVGASFSGEPSDRLGFARLDYGTREVVGEGILRRSRTSTLGRSALTGRRRRQPPAKEAGSGANAGHLDRICVEESARRAGARKCSPDPGAELVGESEPVEVLDRGLMVRFTPYEGGHWFFRRSAVPEGNVRFDVAYGLGIQNEPDEQIVFPIGPKRSRRSDRTFHASWHRTACLAKNGRRVSRYNLGWVIGPHSEYWSVSVAAGRETESYPGTGDDRITIDPVERFGLKWSFSTSVAFRYGYVEDERGRVKGNTLGISLGLQYRGFAGARWDFASIPQARRPGRRSTGMRSSPSWMERKSRARCDGDMRSGRNYLTLRRTKSGSA